jgi:predicted transglutaminase-like cysteine proteinase
MNNVAQNAATQDFAVRSDRFRKFGRVALLASTVTLTGLMQGCASTASVAPRLASGPAPAQVSTPLSAQQPGPSTPALMSAVVSPAPQPAAISPPVHAPQEVARSAESAPEADAQPPVSQLARVERSQGANAPVRTTADSAQAFAAASVANVPRHTFSLPPSRSSGAGADAPNIFGSVALAVGPTPSSGSWRRVASAPLPGLAGPWAQVEVKARSLPAREQLRVVNAWVNHAIAFTDDARLYRTSDYWATAAESLRRGQGDCEDYAIAKMQLLRALGVSSDHLYLVVARDLVRHADHALLAVRIDGRFWILDSATDTVLSADQVRDYRPILTYSENHAWMHGYKRVPAAPSVMMADAGGSPTMGAAAP